MYLMNLKRLGLLKSSNILVNWFKYIYQGLPKNFVIKQNKNQPETD